MEDPGPRPQALPRKTASTATPPFSGGQPSSRKHLDYLDKHETESQGRKERTKAEY